MRGFPPGHLVIPSDGNVPVRRLHTVTVAGFPHQGARHRSLLSPCLPSARTGGCDPSNTERLSFPDGKVRVPLFR